jgi:hypothetical protein
MKTRLSSQAKFLVCLTLISLAFVLIHIEFKYFVLAGVVHVQGWLGVALLGVVAAFLLAVVMYFCTRKAFLRKVSRWFLIVFGLNSLLNLLGLIFFSNELFGFVSALQPGVTEFHLVLRYVLGIVFCGYLYKQV